MASQKCLENIVEKIKRQRTDGNKQGGIYDVTLMRLRLTTVAVEKL